MPEVSGNQSRKLSPWSWLPTLYVAEGLPYFAVNTLTVLMYSNLGVSKTEMAFFTGWLYLPWVIKPFWSPFVDIIRTKRWWILAMQLIMCVCMAAVALFLSSSAFFFTTLTAFFIMAFASATHDISADGFYMLALDEKQQAAYVGVRSTFYRIASVLGQGGLVYLAGRLEESLGDVPAAWSLTFAILSAFFLLIFFYHGRMLPRPAADRAMRGGVGVGGEKPGVGDIALNFVKTFATFFRKPHIIAALCFMLLYRLPEAFCVKMVQPFLKDPLALGGLGMETAEIGIVNGTIGVIALLAGGIIGGLAVARGGLKRWLWPMAASLALPCAVYCYLAAVQPDSFLLISVLIGIEQFGYGFGFTAFMLYLMYFSRGESSTSHYAFCTAFMALGMMLPGMAAGWLFDKFQAMAEAGFTLLGWHPRGYEMFFLLVMLTTLATFGATAAIHTRLPEEQES